MSTTFRDCLEDLVDRLDEEQEQTNCEAWRRFLFDDWDQDVFTPPRRSAAPPAVAWPPITPARAADDGEAMMLSQFAACSEILACGGGGRLGVCCDYGPSMLPSLFGCKITAPDSPARPVRSMQALIHLPDAGMPDIKTALAGRVFETAAMFAETFDRYHTVGQHVTLHMPELPDALGLVLRLAGPKRFTEVRRDGSMLADLLALATGVLAEFGRQWYAAIPHRGEATVHGPLAYKGRVVLRVDLPPAVDAAFYAQHVALMDQSLLDRVGGGVMILSGRAHQLIEPLSGLRGLTGIVLEGTLPADMEKVYRLTVDKGIKILSLDRKLAAKAGRPMKGQVHCP